MPPDPTPVEPWLISRDPSGQYWLVKTVPDSAIGPFPDQTGARCALDELLSARRTH